MKPRFSFILHAITGLLSLGNYLPLFIRKAVIVEFLKLGKQSFPMEKTQLFMNSLRCGDREIHLRRKALCERRLLSAFYFLMYKLPVHHLKPNEWYHHISQNLYFSTTSFPQTAPTHINMNLLGDSAAVATYLTVRIWGPIDSQLALSIREISDELLMPLQSWTVEEAVIELIWEFYSLCPGMIKVDRA